MSKQNTKPATALIEIFDHSLSYCDPNLKKAFHREGKKVLRKLAALMGLQKSKYDVRSNTGGIAVSGEVILQTERLYVQIDQTIAGPQSFIMMRTCNGRKDYTGGMNHFAPITALADLERFALHLEGIAGNMVCGMCWVPEQVRIDIAQIRANRVLSPELERVRARFEAGDLSIEVFEQAIEHAERIRAAA
jgi:hypothetical protein